MRYAALSISTLIALSSAGLCSAQRVEFTHAADIINLRSREKTTVRAGETAELSENQSYQVVSADRLPVFLVSLSDSEKIQVSAPNLPEYVESDRNKKLNLVTGDVLSRINDIQALIQQKRLDEAQKKIDLLKQDYPGMTYLDFVQASLLFLRGQRGEALRLAEAAAVEFPNYQEGKTFIEQLKKGNAQ